MFVEWNDHFLLQKGLKREFQMLTTKMIVRMLLIHFLNNQNSIQINCIIQKKRFFQQKANLIEEGNCWFFWKEIRIEINKITSTFIWFQIGICTHPNQLFHFLFLIFWKWKENFELNVDCKPFWRIWNGLMMLIANSFPKISFKSRSSLLLLFIVELLILI